MKTSEELTTLKEEVAAVSEKLRALTDDELEQVIGGCGAGIEEPDDGVSEIIRKLMETIKEVKEKAAVLAELKGAKVTLDPIQEREERLHCGWLDQSDP